MANVSVRPEPTRRAHVALADRVHIKKAAVADAPTIAALIASVSREFITQDFDEALRAQFDQVNDKHAIREALRSGHTYHLALRGTELLGVAGVRNNNHLRHLFVVKDHQRLGLGRLLWATALRESLARGGHGVVTTHAAHSARTFYERLGFVEDMHSQSDTGLPYTPMRYVMTLDSDRRDESNSETGNDARYSSQRGG